MTPQRRRPRRRNGLPRPHQQRTRGAERGQVSVVLGVVMLLGLLMVLALAALGAAVIGRATARTAADAVALAAASGPAEGEALARWYREQNIDVEVGIDSAWASSGPSQAQAWARSGAAAPDIAPVVAAAFARAQQLANHPVEPLAISLRSVTVAATDARILEPHLRELGFCVDSSTEALATVRACR